MWGGIPPTKKNKNVMINIVIGKPGSGKTYHMVRYIYDVVSDLLRKDTLDRVIYTNVSVNIDEFNRQLSEEFKTEIDVTCIIKTLSADDLRYDSSLIDDEDKQVKRVAGKAFYSVNPNSLAFFWNRFADNALIIIDEIQKYLSTVKEESESEKQSLIEYFSLHRHKRHDWFLITQNLLSIPVEVRRVSEKVYNVFNAKSLNLGFPINVPLRDIEILLAGFNVHRQVYRVREGYLESTYRVAYEDSVQVVVMSKKVFALYQTHTQLESADNPSIFQGDSTLPFELGKGQRLRAVRWFIGKHGFHLGLKLFIVVWFITGILSFFKVGIFADDTSEPVEDLPVSAALIHNEDDQEETSGNLAASSPSNDGQETLSAPPVVVYNRVAYINGYLYSVGDIYDSKRITSISARGGVEFEPPEIEYLRGFDFLLDCRRGL